MERDDIEALREKISCGAVLERGGWRVDLKESTRRAVKYRREAEIIIVIHDGKGWFDPLSDRKGDIFDLLRHIEGLGFQSALKVASDLIGWRVAGSIGSHPECNPKPRSSTETPAARWAARAMPEAGSRTLLYLSKTRCLPPAIVAKAVADGWLRSGPYGSAWFAHREARVVVGWEERGEGWRGFATGGTKSLFRFGSKAPTRVCVTESAIDALSLAAIEGLRQDTLYASTAGGWSPRTQAAVSALSRPDRKLVAATDRDSQGEAFADKLRAIAGAKGCDFYRLRPRANDWNDDLGGVRDQWSS